MSPAVAFSVMPEEELFVGPLLIDAGAPYDVAKLFVEHRFTADDTRTLHYHRGGFYRWSGTAYAGLGDDAARSALYDFLNGCETTDKKTGDKKPVKPNRNLIGNVSDALRAAA